MLNEVHIAKKVVTFSLFPCTLSILLSSQAFLYDSTKSCIWSKSISKTIMTLLTKRQCSKVIDVHIWHYFSYTVQILVSLEWSPSLNQCIIFIFINYISKHCIECWWLETCQVSVEHVNNIPTMQVFTEISRNTQSKSYMLSLTECIWEFPNNALWDTQ